MGAAACEQQHRHFVAILHFGGHPFRIIIMNNSGGVHTYRVTYRVFPYLPQIIGERVATPGVGI